MFNEERIFLFGGQSLDFRFYVSYRSPPVLFYGPHRLRVQLRLESRVNKISRLCKRSCYTMSPNNRFEREELN